MPIHDWTRVDHGRFHHFCCGWVNEIRGAMNRHILPPGVSAMLASHPDPDSYTGNRPVVEVRRGDTLTTLVEVVYPWTKAGRRGVELFTRKVVTAIEHGLHVLVLDLFPPGPHDPQGIHALIWSAFCDAPCPLPEGKPVAFTSYCADSVNHAHLESAAVGELLPETPLFLTSDRYVPLPLESIYSAAFGGISRRTRDLLGG